MTNEELDALQGLCDGATPGQWALPLYGYTVETAEKKLFYAFGMGESVFADMRFVCASRTAMPQLISEVRRLQGESPAWIDVNDRLPERPEHDWVLVKVKMVPEGWYGVPQIAEMRKDGKWHVRDMDTPYEETVSTKITHWMPIPDPAI